MISNLKTKTLTFLVGVSMLLLTACATGQKQSNDVSAATVKVTNTQGNHGGTGIVLRSSQFSSLVLTNSHVCGVVEDGGMVSGFAGKFMVSGYKKSTHHDLCLIKVEGNLGYNTKVADRPPVAYYERATVSGHPALYPNVKTYGHFSGYEQIQVMTGVRPCTKEELDDNNKAFFCVFAGGIPVIKTYQSQLVTATIMPGSSGSGVYNKDGELSGVVFAGASNLGYGWTVPYEAMKHFLTVEQYQLNFETPSNEIDIFGEAVKKEKESESLQKLHDMCGTALRMKHSSFCKIIDSDFLK